MEAHSILATWQMWATMLIVLIAVYFYIREQFSIEVISVGVISALLIFFHFFAPDASEGLDSSSLLSGFAAPALITIMALLVVGQGCLLYTSPSPRDKRQSRMPSSA